MYMPQLLDDNRNHSLLPRSSLNTEGGGCGIRVQYPLEVDAIGFNESRLSFSHWVIVHMRYHSDYSHTCT